MDDLLNVISKTFSADQSQLNQALSYLDQIGEQNFAWLVSAFVEIICCTKHTGTVDSFVPYKLQSVLQLKNLLLKKPECWHALDNHTKERIKTSLLSCFQLADVRLIRLSQVVETVATLELPHNSWPQLIPDLLKLGASPGVQGSAAVQTLGYICECVDPEILECFNNQILTLLVALIRNPETILSTRIDGMNALQNCLQFAASNFARLQERNQLMQVICEGTQSSEVEMKMCSLQCLCAAVSLYYPLMDKYMDQAIWPISLSCLAATNDAIVMQGLEVINCVCEAEMKMVEEGDEQTDCIIKVLPQLISGVTQAFMTSGPSVPLEWNVCQASQVTLRIMSLATGDSMVNMMMPTLLANMRHQDVMVLSCVLMCTASLMEQSHTHSIQPLIQAFLDATPVIIFHQSSKVRYHGGVALSQLCLHQHHHLFNINSVSFIISLIIRSLQMMLDLQVVEQCCWAVRYLLENLEENLTFQILDEYINLLHSLYQLTSLPDKQGDSVEKVNYETLVLCAELCPEECRDRLTPLLVSLLDRMITLHPQSPALDYACTAVNVLLSKVAEDFLQERCSDIFSMLCHLVTYRCSVVETVLTMLSTLLDRVPHTFLACNIPHLFSLLIDLLQDLEGLSACSIGLMSDVYRSSSDLTLVPDLQHSHVIAPLLKLVQDANTDNVLKALSLGTVSDIILCTESTTSHLHAPVLQVLHELTTGPTSSHKLTDDTWICAATSPDQLVKSVIETYSTLIQVFHQVDQFKDLFIQKHADPLADYIVSLDDDLLANEEVLTVLCGVLGDLGKYLPDAGLEEYQDKFQNILQLGLDSRETRIRRIAKWARDQIPAVSGCTVVKKARVETDEMETGGGQSSYSFRVSLSCSTSQYITQNIEETFTLNLGSNKCTSSNSTVQSDMNSNYVEATVHLPSPGSSKLPAVSADSNRDAVTADYSLAAVRQLRKLGKRRAATFLESCDGKKLRDEDENSFW